MNLKQLVETVTWEEVLVALRRHYYYGKKDCPVEGYQHVWDQLLQLPLVDQPGWSLEIKPWDESELDPNKPENALPADVTGRRHGDDRNYAIEYTRWEEVLSMVVLPSSYTDAENVAHILWEITFAGYDQDQIQRQIEDINKRAEEVSNMTPEEREANLYSWDEVKKTFVPTC